MATRSPAEHHSHWRTYPSASQLPNVSGSSTQSAHLEVGDIAYVAAIGLYQCDVATLGAAVWSQPGGGIGGAASEFDWSSDYPYTQQSPSVEETIGYGRLDGSAIGGTAYFRATWNPQFGAAGTARVRLYDLGPVAGPPAVPTLIATLTTAASGLRYDEQSLTVGGSPSLGQIMNTPRMYEVTVQQNSQAGDSVYVGSAGISDR
jgi:hypothetical protein